ncbi:MAG: TlpA family protein disulfide reductase [Actinobacteria bacterium]|nr:TlpA family protein disulfide reductase [Actinomycetota bacterium]
MNGRRNKYIKVITVFLLSIILIGVGWIMRKNIEMRIYDMTHSLKTGSKAPDFKIENLKKEIVTLNKLKGKVVLINFWAIYCPPCKEELPVIQSIHEKYNEDELVVLTINKDNNIDKVISFMDENDYSFPVAMENKEMTDSYGGGWIPYVVLIDKQGIVCYAHRGYRVGDEQELISEIENLLGDISQ